MKELISTGTWDFKDTKVLCTSQTFVFTQTASDDSGTQSSAIKQPINSKRNRDKPASSIIKKVLFFACFFILYSFYGRYTVSSNNFLVLPTYPSISVKPL